LYSSVLSGLEACALLVASSTTTAVNVGDVDNRNHSTSRTLCRFDNLQHDLFNLSLHGRIKYLSTAFSVKTFCSLHTWDVIVFSDRSLQFRAHGQDRLVDRASATVGDGQARWRQRQIGDRDD